eukprot:gene13673-13789_t
MRPLLDVILLVLDLYMDVIIGVAILSWLIAFNVINLHNDLVRSVWNALNGLTEPVLRPIRSILPNMGTLDISPIVVMLVIFLLKREIMTYVYPNLTPKSSRDALGAVETLSDDSQVLRAYVRVVPEDGKANLALIKVLSSALKLPKSAIELESGATSRMKTFFITGDAEKLEPVFRALGGG